MNGTKIPFAHGNLSLAVSLHLAGAKIINVERVYTAEDERKFGLTCSKAAEQDIGGRPVFVHEPVDNIAALIEAYDAQRKADDFTISPFNMQAESGKLDEMQVRIGCLAMQVRKQLQDILRDPQTARIAKSNGPAVTSESNGVKMLTSPGLKMCADVPELRKELGL